MDREGPSPVRLAAGSLTDYFVECVDLATAEHGVEVDPHVRAYLVNLLTSFAERKALLTEDLDDLLSQPIAIQVQKALQATPARRFQLLRQVGDFSLYMVGFFSESVDRGVVPPDYYCDMGAGAYQGAAHTLSGTHDNPFRQLYAGLAARFREMAGLLNGVSERCFGQHDQDVLRLYERFRATGSRRLAARLAQLGVAVGAEPRMAQ